MERRMDELANLMKGADIVRINDSNPADIIRALTGQQITPRRPASQDPWIDGHHPPSAADSVSLEHIGVAQLVKGQRSAGKVIYLRILSQRDTKLGTVFAAEDHTGAEAHVWSLIFRPLGIEQIPRDTIIAIREPYFGRDPLEARSICLHHSTDCLYVSRCDPIIEQLFETRFLPEDTDFIKLADLAMIKGNFLEALNLYDCHLETIYRRGLYRVKDKNGLLIKRAFCNDRAGGHFAALADCVAILATDPTHIQALKLGYVKALAKDSPRQALGFAERLVQSKPDNSAFQDVMSKAQAKVQESMGVFDFGLHIRQLGLRGTCADMSTFSGSLEIKLSSLGGRGVFATKDLNPDELLLCEKPMALGTSDKISAFARGLQDILAGETSSQRHLSLLQNICAKALVDPSTATSEEDLRTKLFSLCAGDDFPHDASPSDPPLSIDTYRALSIIKHNCHTVLPGTMSIHHDTGDLANQYPRHESLPSTKDFYAGLWYTGALFNHSCLPNCTWSWIGDMFITRANRAIVAGEELTLAYIPSSNDYEKRRNTLKSQYGFECGCQFCQADATITPEGKAARTKISELLNKKFPNVVKLNNGKVSSTAITNLERHVKNVIDSYSSPAYTNLPHLLLADTYYQLAHVYLGPINTWSTTSSYSKLKAYECFVSCLEIGLIIKLLFSPTSAYCELHLTETSLPRSVGILALMGLAELKFLEGRLKACRALKWCAKKIYGIVYGESDSFGDRHRSYACWKETAEVGERPENWWEVREAMVREEREGPEFLLK